MTISDLCESIATLLVPAPGPNERSGDPDLLLDDLLEVRRSTAERLRAISEGTDEDPLLVALSEAYARRSQADRELRLLLAFGREFVRPRPYELAALAGAGGFSASGTKTAYKGHHVAAVAAALGRSPVSRRVRSSSRPSGRAEEASHAVLPASASGPRYLRIAADLREQIRSGSLPPGSRLLSVRELMTAYGVAMATVRHGLQVLIDEQLIHAVQGAGTFVGAGAALPASPVLPEGAR